MEDGVFEESTWGDEGVLDSTGSEGLGGRVLQGTPVRGGGLSVMIVGERVGLFGVYLMLEGKRVGVTEV